MFGFPCWILTDYIEANVVNPHGSSAYQLHSIREHNGTVRDGNGCFDLFPSTASFDKTARRLAAKTIAKRDSRTVDIIRTNPKTSALGNIIASEKGFHFDALAKVRSGGCGLHKSSALSRIRCRF